MLSAASDGDVAHGEEKGLSGSDDTVNVKASGAAGVTPPTFAELKTTGARRSRYLKSDARPFQAEVPKPQLAQFHNEILPVLKQSCVKCHGPDTREGNLRIDTLDPNLQKGDDVSWWLEVLAVLNNGEMPPPDEGQLTDTQRTKIVEWLSSEIQLASAVRRSERASSSFRRMTRYEYNYILQDMLGLPWNFAKDLPPEATSEDGFQNSSELLHMTVMQLETYRTIARQALMRTLPSGKQPPVLYWGITMNDAAAVEWPKQEEQLQKARDKFKDDPGKLGKELERLLASFKQPHRGTYYRNLATGQTAQATWAYYGAKYAFAPRDQLPVFPSTFDHVAVLPRGQSLIVELGDQVPDQGMMRVRVRAARGSAEDSGIPSMQLEFGWRASNEGRALVRVSLEDTAVTEDPAHPGIYEWNVPLGEIYPRNSVRKVTKMGAMPSPSEYIRFVNSSVSQGDIQIDYVEVATPVYPSWPPASHSRIFMESENRGDESAYAREVLQAFMTRAWRRDVTNAEVDLKLAFFHTLRPECDSFEEAVIEVLATVLSAPQFLYLARSTLSEDTHSSTKKRFLPDDELATRLSMFLWCSSPDKELLELASKGQLGNVETLSGQVKRMLEDSRSQRFSKQFVHQWLDLQLLDYLDVDKKIHPQFSSALKEAMMHEPIAFFHEILQTNSSILDFIHADYTMVNEVLARHYGINEVYGNHFRRVGLDLKHRRGGMLTQAGLLTMNSAGADSHPLKRGIWLLENVLNDPPPPPPPAVPEIDLADPEIAKMTLKQRIEDHRNHAACLSCHAKIDPWGIAFENYDALGRWRNQINGQPVDATSRLFNDQELSGMDGLKRFLLENRQDQFTRAMAYKMTAFALGRPLKFADHSSVDEITAKLRKQQDGLADLITSIVTSELFRVP